MADSAENVEPTSLAKVRDRGEVMSNTVAGPRATDPAVPLILAGVRTALALHVRTATPATFGVGGGLGDPVSSGITNQRMPLLVLGSVLTVAMAPITDWPGTLVELLLRPRGLEVN